MTATKLEVLKEMKVMLEESTRYQFLCHFAYRAISKLDGVSANQASKTGMYADITEQITQRISDESTVEIYVEKYIGEERYYPAHFRTWVSNLRHRIIDEMIAAEEVKQKDQVHPYAVEIHILEMAKKALIIHTFLCTAVEQVAFSHYSLLSDDMQVSSIKKKITQEIKGAPVMEAYFEVEYGFCPNRQDMLTARLKLADKLIAHYKEMK